MPNSNELQCNSVPYCFRKGSVTHNFADRQSRRTMTGKKKFKILTNMLISIIFLLDQEFQSNFQVLRKKQEKYIIQFSLFDFFCTFIIHAFKEQDLFHGIHCHKKKNVQNKQYGWKMRVVFPHSKVSHLLLLLAKFKLAPLLNFVGLYLQSQWRKVSNLSHCSEDKT